MRRVAASVVLVLVAATGCRGASGFLPPGQYSGSTTSQQAVNVDIGDKVTLDGIELRFTPSHWLVGAHDKKVRMRCHTADRDTEIVCTIERHGQTETDELLKL